MTDTVRTGARAPAMDRFSLPGLLRARETGVFLALVVLCLFLTFATDGFLTSVNLLNVGRQISLLGIMAVGTSRSELIVQLLHTELLVECKTWTPTGFLQLALPGQQALEIEHVGPQLTVAIGTALAAY